MDDIINHINRFITVYAIAADEDAFKKEYAKKFYKLIASVDRSLAKNKDTISLFAKLQAGLLQKDQLKHHVRQIQNKRAGKDLRSYDTIPKFQNVDQAIKTLVFTYDEDISEITKRFLYGQKMEKNKDLPQEQIDELVYRKLMTDINYYLQE